MPSGKARGQPFIWLPVIRVRCLQPLVHVSSIVQAAEPEALIPLTRGASHAVLVGDHMQLGPVCNSSEAGAAGLAVSLFERLMAAGVPSAMLQAGSILVG